jgi:hypothetical protein
MTCKEQRWELELERRAQGTFWTFHWQRGNPLEETDHFEKYTWWEQLDGGKQYTLNKKFLTIVPVVL